jgi:hypothetical protein
METEPTEFSLKMSIATRRPDNTKNKQAMAANEKKHLIMFLP